MDEGMVTEWIDIPWVSYFLSFVLWISVLRIRKRDRVENISDRWDVLRSTAELNVRIAASRKEKKESNKGIPCSFSLDILCKLQQFYETLWLIAPGQP